MPLALRDHAGNLCKAHSHRRLHHAGDGEPQPAPGGIRISLAHQPHRILRRTKRLRQRQRQGACRKAVRYSGPCGRGNRGAAPRAARAGRDRAGRKAARRRLPPPAGARDERPARRGGRAGINGTAGSLAHSGLQRAAV